MIKAQPLSVPNEGPVSLAALRTYLRIDTSDDDTTLQAILLAARLAVEQRTGRILTVQTWRLRLDSWPDNQRVRVPLFPFRRLIAARIFDANGQSVAIAASSIVNSEPGFIGFNAAPQPGRPEGGIEIDVEVGYAGAADIPAALILAVMRKAARLYEARGDESDARHDETLEALIAPFITRRLA